MPQTEDTVTDQTPDTMIENGSANTNQQQNPEANGKNVATPTPTSDRVMLELRKYILLLASLVATVTYAAAFSPPGDVWEDTADGHLAGDPIIMETHHKRYLAFFYCNATAFAASVVVIVLVFVLSSLDDKEDPNSKIVGWYRKNPLMAVRPLQAVMVVDLLSLLGAYAAGTCRDTFTTVYSSLLVGIAFVYLVVQMVAATLDKSGSSGGSKNPGNGGSPEVGERVKADERFRKVLILLATFAVSITYVAGMSTPGGFWGATGPGHRPGDAILKDRHNARLAAFLSFNTTAFVASLLIIVVLLDRILRQKYAYGFLVVAMVSLIGAYTAGSCRHTDTTVYVLSLVPAVLLYILFLLLVVCAIEAMRKQEESKNAREEQEQEQEQQQQQPTHVEAAAKHEPTEKEKAADKARSLVLLLATLAATITYQAGLVPPGGVWQDNADDHKAGDPILLTRNGRRYKAFYYCNSISFVASLLAIVLVQKKLLLNHHVLEAVMILDLFGLIGAYAAGSCRDVSSSIYAMALAGAVLVYVVIHVIFATLDHTSNRRKSDELVEKTRKRLLLFAILAATITYQAGLTPPGGFLQDDQAGHHAGDPVLLFNFPRRYNAFFYCNSLSFMLSIALILLLVNPNLYRPAIRSHALSVCTAIGLFGLMGAYAAGSTQHLQTSIYIFVLVGVVLLLVLLFFLLFWYIGHGSGEGNEGSNNSNTSQGVAMGTDMDSSNTRSSNGDRYGQQQQNMNAAITGTQHTEQQQEEEATNKTKRIHAKRKYLMLLGILVASVTYQAGLEPPGGAWQDSSDGHEAGNPVMHNNRRARYLAFFYSNSTSFMASIVVILLLLVPKNQFDKHREWLRSWLVVMNTTIVLDLLCLLGAYAAGSSRGWKTSVYVFVLVIAVLAYMAIHFVLSWTSKRRRQKTPKNNQVKHDPEE